MPSPFPGMNPYLEQPSVWEDFHSRFMTYAGESLATQVRPNFLVKLSVATFDPALNQVKSILATIPDVEIERHAVIEIRDRLDRQLVTMIEVLSPSNKRYGPDREQYLLKRATMMFSSASIVEIDLLRGGPRLPINDLPACDYCVTVFRKAKAPKVEAWPIGLRDELPVIPVPLKGDFADAKLDLKALIDRVYDAAGYEDYLYESFPEPPFDQTDAIWAQAFITQ